MVVQGLRCRHIRQHRLREAEPLGFAQQMMIEISTVPVSVGYLVMRTCRHKHLLIETNIAWATEFMMEERKTALQAAGNLGIMPLPSTPLGEGKQRGQVVAGSELLQQKVREWC